MLMGAAATTINNAFGDSKFSVFTLGNEHGMQYVDDVLLAGTLETCVVL